MIISLGIFYFKPIIYDYSYVFYVTYFGFYESRERRENNRSREREVDIERNRERYRYIYHRIEAYCTGLNLIP